MVFFTQPKGPVCSPDRERIRMSFWRRYKDYLVKHPGHKQSPDACKAGVAFHAVGANC